MKRVMGSYWDSPYTGAGEDTGTGPVSLDRGITGDWITAVAGRHRRRSDVTSTTAAKAGCSIPLVSNKPVRALLPLQLNHSTEL